MKLTELENEAKDYYDNVWSNPNRIRQIVREIPSWHFGFYENGINNPNEAKINMMEYVGRLLELDDESYSKILDAGSGVGSTSIYLAKKYSNCIFHGITISHYESLLAGILQKKNKISNVRFQQGTYMKTSYSKNYFDRIFALESVIYAPNKKEFVKEMHRILKPNGKIVILDIFPKKYQFNSLSIKIDNYLYQRKNSENLKNYYIGIDQFAKFLKSEKFVGIKIHNLIDAGNIKKFILFKSIFLSAYALLISKLRTIDKKIPFKYKFISPFIFFMLIMYKLLIGINSNEYYSIEAIKK
jgi:cyclopropane fatty-acyl-phospholipid synthase-like methyltransferase